jgi:hypothetical protein
VTLKETIVCAAVGVFAAVQWMWMFGTKGLEKLDRRQIGNRPLDNVLADMLALVQRDSMIIDWLLQTHWVVLLLPLPAAAARDSGTASDTGVHIMSWAPCLHAKLCTPL